MNKQIRYTKDVAEKIYLSPYTDIKKLTDTALFLKRRDKENGIQLECESKEALDLIINSVYTGIAKKDLKSLVGSQEWIDLLLSYGVIE